MIAKQSEVWRVLMVDDNEDDYLITRSMLGEAQARKVMLDWAPSYQAGQVLLQANHYDAVLVDYDLGSRTGIELIHETTAQGYSAPLILYTGRGSYEVDVEAMQAGATLYVTKTEATPLMLERSLRYAIERKRIEEELDRQLQERSDILESIQDGFFSIDRNWVITYINQRAARNGGYEPEELISKNIWEAFPKFLGSSFEQNYRHVMDARIPVQFEIQGVYKGVWYNISVYPSAEGISVYWQDISERKRMEAELHSLAQFPDENPNPVMRISAEGALMYANTSCKTLLLNWGCEGQPGLPENLLTAAAEALKIGSAKELDLECEDRAFLFVITPIPNQRYVNLYGVDITERKQAERALQAYVDQLKRSNQELQDLSLKTT